MKTKTINLMGNIKQYIVRPRFEVVEAAIQQAGDGSRTLGIMSVVSMHSTTAKAWRALHLLAKRREEGAHNLYVWDAERKVIVPRRQRMQAA